MHFGFLPMEGPQVTLRSVVFGDFSENEEPPRVGGWRSGLQAGGGKDPPWSEWTPGPGGRLNTKGPRVKGERNVCTPPPQRLEQRAERESCMGRRLERSALGNGLPPVPAQPPKCSPWRLGWKGKKARPEGVLSRCRPLGPSPPAPRSTGRGRGRPGSRVLPSRAKRAASASTFRGQDEGCAPPAHPAGRSGADPHPPKVRTPLLPK